MKSSLAFLALAAIIASTAGLYFGWSHYRDSQNTISSSPPSPQPASAGVSNSSPSGTAAGGNTNTFVITKPGRESAVGGPLNVSSGNTSLSNASISRNNNNTMTTTNNSASDTEKIAPALIYTQVSSGFNVVPLIHTVVGVENEAYDAGNGTSHHLLFLEIQSNHNWHGILTTEKNDSLALNPEVHYPLDGSGNLKKAFACPTNALCSVLQNLQQIDSVFGVEMLQHKQVVRPREARAQQNVSEWQLRAVQEAHHL